MSYIIDAYKRFRPIRDYDLNSRSLMLAGSNDSDPSSPWRTGLATLLYNHTTIWAQIGHPMILDSQQAQLTLTAANTSYDVAVYKFPVGNFLPSDSGSTRRFLRVKVTGKVSDGTWTFRARTGTGIGTTSTTGGSESTTIDDVYVPIPVSTPECTLILSISGTFAMATFTFEGISAWIAPEDDTGALEWWGASGDNDRIWPLDAQNQGAGNSPVHVEVVRSFLQQNAILYRNNFRQVINFCAIRNYGNLWMPATTTNDDALTIGALILGQRAFHQWLYFPRPGAKLLYVRLEAYVPSWADADDTVGGYFGFGPDNQIRFQVNKANAFGSEVWLSSQILPIPTSGDQPLIMELGAMNTDEKYFRVMALSVYEFADGS